MNEIGDALVIGLGKIIISMISAVVLVRTTVAILDSLINQKSEKENNPK